MPVNIKRPACPPPHEDIDIVDLPNPSKISLKQFRQLEEKLQQSEVLNRELVEEKERLREKIDVVLRQSRAWLEHSPACTKIVDLDFNLHLAIERSTDKRGGSQRG